MGKAYKVKVKNICKDKHVGVTLNEEVEEDISIGHSSTRDLDLANDKLTIRIKDDNPHIYSLRIPSDPENKYKMLIKWNDNRWVLRMKEKPSQMAEGPTEVNVTVGEDEPTLEG